MRTLAFFSLLIVLTLLEGTLSKKKSLARQHALKHKSDSESDHPAPAPVPVLSSTAISSNNDSSINSTNETVLTAEEKEELAQKEYNNTHFGTCPNTPGRDDLYWIRDEYMTTISTSANFDSKWYYQTDRHTDMRYAKKPIYGERRELLPELIGSWARWCDDNNIKYFIAHGSLLGWVWNGRSLLWDEDGDVIVDQATFQYLLQFNGSTLLGKYTLDLNPHWVHRGYGGNNKIDGEWIDTETGVYIDITILVHTQHHINTTAAKFVSETENCTENCIEDKSIHRYKYDVIYPLQRITFEGVGVWAPNNIEQHLDQEYTDYGRLVPEFFHYDQVDGVWDGDKPPGEVKRPIRPQRLHKTNQFVRYGFDYEKNDWIVTEVSERKKNDFIGFKERVPESNPRCHPTRSFEYTSRYEPGWVPLLHYCWEPSVSAKRLTEYKYKMPIGSIGEDINCLACVPRK